MVVGFNHNFRYKGDVFHVQTEDGGLKSPQIVTLLYRGGTILASKKTSYADITKVDNLEQVVEELMKEQHREMLRRLKGGEFDEIIGGSLPAAPQTSPPPQPIVSSQPVSPQPGKKEAELPATLPQGSEKREKVLETSLDEVILSYLMGEDRKS